MLFTVFYNQQTDVVLYFKGAFFEISFLLACDDVGLTSSGVNEAQRHKGFELPLPLYNCPTNTVYLSPLIHLFHN